MSIIFHYANGETKEFDEYMEPDFKKRFENMYYKVFTAHSDNPIYFAGVVVKREQVEFHCERPYAIVYSAKWPKKIRDSHSDSFLVERLARRWYQVAGNK